MEIEYTFPEMFFKRIEVETEILVHAKQIATNTTSFLQQDLKRRFEHPYAAYRVPLLLAQVLYTFAGSAVLTSQEYTYSRLLLILAPFTFVTEMT